MHGGPEHDFGYGRKGRNRKFPSVQWNISYKRVEEVFIRKQEGNSWKGEVKDSKICQWPIESPLLVFLKFRVDPLYHLWTENKHCAINYYML